MTSLVKDIIADENAQRMTASHIAEAAGLDRKTVSSILNGENENPKIETLQAIARCLGGEIIYSTVDSTAAVKSGDISYYRTLIAAANKAIEQKQEWIKALFITCLGLIAANITVGMVAMVIISKL